VFAPCPCPAIRSDWRRAIRTHDFGKRFCCFNDFCAERCNQPVDVGARVLDCVGLDGERPVAAAIAAASGRRFVALQRNLNRGQGGIRCFHMLPRAGP
jgi:hypothetical protein